jgi:hypothetical protein
MEIKKNLEEEKPKPIMTTHPYTVLGTFIIEGEEYMVLRNPWGKSKPTESGSTVVTDSNLPILIDHILKRKQEINNKEQAKFIIDQVKNWDFRDWDKVLDRMRNKEKDFAITIIESMKQQSTQDIELLKSMLKMMKDLQARAISNIEKMASI